MFPITVAMSDYNYSNSAYQTLQRVRLNFALQARSHSLSRFMTYVNVTFLS